jgi:hypothetical protein
VAYANEREHLQTLTPQALEWAKQFVGLALKGAGGSTWTAQEAWVWMRAHQEEFQRLLDALIAGHPTREQIQVLTEHLRHVQPWCSWHRLPDQVQEQEEDPDRWEGFRQTLLANGHDIGGPRRSPPPSPYLRRINAQDPLDELYWELDQFLDKDGQSRLRKCPQCGRYFVQATARRQTYCMTSCQQKANPMKRQQNAAYQRAYRARQQQGQIKEDLKRVREFKQAFITNMGEPPMLEDVLEKLHITRRSWNTLVNWEIEKYGHPRDTNLPA